MTHRKFPLMLCEHTAQIVALSLEYFIAKMKVPCEIDTEEDILAHAVMIKMAMQMREKLTELCPELPEPDFDW